MAVDATAPFSTAIHSPVEQPWTTVVAPRIINGTTTNQFPSVGIVGDSTFGGYCTGTLIAPRYVLSAAHCAVDNGVKVGDSAGRVTFGSTTYATSQVIVHPSYNEAQFGTDAANDIAIYKLTTPVVGITPSNIFRSIPLVGASMTLVGFGGGGTGSTGTDGSFGTKRFGITPIDGVSSTLIHWDFDNNSESNTAPGDSGGPSFLQVGSELLVAGVTSGGTLTSAGLGDQSYNTRVDVYQSWIDGIVNQAATTNFIDYLSAGTTYTQNFNSLATSGTSSTLPSGWSFSESGTNANTLYSANNGVSNSGDTYSFGTAGSTDRALGGLQSSSLIPTFGAAIKNSTGSNLTTMSIGYVGEQWRLGTAGRADRLDFQYSLNATSLTDGTWTNVDALDFSSPVTSGTVGQLDGNVASNRSSRTAAIGSLNIPNGATFWLRWNDFGASGADDGLAIDDFTFSASGGSVTNTAPTISTPANQQTPFQTATAAIAFSVGDAETPASNLTVSATSSNLALIPSNGITLGGSRASRSITLTPATGQSGTSTISLSVSDGGLTTTTSFQLTVLAGTGTTSNLRIVSYNISGASSFGLRAGFETILAGIGSEIVNGVSRQVDLFALQEVVSQATTSALVASSLNNLYGTTAYATGTLNGATTGSGTQGVVYNTQTLVLMGEALVGTASTTGAPRQTLRHHFRPVGTTGSSDFYVYNSHLKASDTSADAQRRFADVQVIRDDADSLGQGAHIIYVGDFNLFTSNEAAYQEFLSAGNGQAFDPINRPGNWSDNASFRDIFTQAPSANAQPALGLDGGGLDDRLDFQLISGELRDGSGLDYRPNSYHTFGVNGSVAVNGSIDDASNTALPGLPNRLALLGLLRTVSDHLPVVADYTYVVPVASASVVNRKIFYNRSSSPVFGNGSGNPINAIDNAKSALLPGQTASFTNYTSVISGINGLVVDIAGAGTISASDFRFDTWVGFPGGTFVPAGAVPTVTSFSGGGLNGSTRMKIEFADGAIQNTWLRVTVLANANTRLTSNDVFYFGNAIGDFGIGNTGTPIIVRTNSVDIAAIRQNESLAANSATISNVYDVNKDGRVNATDSSLVRQRQALNLLRYFTAPNNLPSVAWAPILAVPLDDRSKENAAKPTEPVVPAKTSNSVVTFLSHLTTNSKATATLQEPASKLASSDKSSNKSLDELTSAIDLFFASFNPHTSAF